MNTENTAVVAKSNKSKRVAYGFELNFPETFTMRDLRNLKNRKVKYITLYMRVKKALANGEISVAGTAESKGGKGRKQLVYRRNELPVATSA